MASTRVPGIRLTSLFLVIAGLTVIGVVLAAWWGVDIANRQQYHRFAYMQLRILRIARDRLENQLKDLEYKTQLLAELPQVINPASMLQESREVLDQRIGKLDLVGIFLRRMGPDGKILLDIPAAVPRSARVSESDQQCLEWAKDPKNRDGTLIELQDPTVPVDAENRGMVRFCVPVWTQDAPNGVLFLSAPTGNLLRSYLEPAALLPESYTFAVYYRVGQETKQSLPTLLSHSTESLWIRSQGSQGSDATEFLKSLTENTSIFKEGGESHEIVMMPARDSTQRSEILTFVPVVFGSQRWMVGLSTPTDKVAEPNADLRMVFILLTILTVAILFVGVGLLYYQRTRFEVEATQRSLERIREMHHDYQNLFAENPTAMLVLDDETELVDCNYSAERLIGLGRHEAIGSRLAEIFDEQSIQTFWKSLEQRGNLHIRDTYLVRQKDRLPVLVEIWGRRIGDSWILMAHDVEQRREFERQIARFKRMDSMGSLASTLAHDFNNLLGQVQILVSHLRTEVPATSPLHGDLSAIEDKVDDASQLVANLLAFRENVISETPVDLEEVLRDFAANQRKVLPKEIDFEFDSRPELPRIWITPHSLRRVLDNLCVNACDAMPYGGHLVIRARPQKVDPQKATDHLKAGMYAVVEVTDTGIGMSPEVLDTIFEPFFTTKSDGKGTGFGLWTVYKIIRRGGGWVDVHSRKGRGTRFTLYLPHVRASGEDSGFRSPAA